MQAVPWLLLFATLTLSGIEDTHELNGVRNVLATGITTVALVCWWPMA